MAKQSNRPPTTAERRKKSTRIQERLNRREEKKSCNGNCSKQQHKQKITCYLFTPHRLYTHTLTRAQPLDTSINWFRLASVQWVNNMRKENTQTDTHKIRHCRRVWLKTGSKKMRNPNLVWLISILCRCLCFQLTLFPIYLPLTFNEFNQQHQNDIHNDDRVDTLCCFISSTQSTVHDKANALTQTRTFIYADRYHDA